MGQIAPKSIKTAEGPYRALGKSTASLRQSTALPMIPMSSIANRRSFLDQKALAERPGMGKPLPPPKPAVFFEFFHLKIEIMIYNE